MLCPECIDEMWSVDATGEGDACWICPRCHNVMDYEYPEELVWDGKDDGDFLAKNNRTSS